MYYISYICHYDGIVIICIIVYTTYMLATVVCSTVTMRYSQ